MKKFLNLVILVWLFVLTFGLLLMDRYHFDCVGKYSLGIIKVSLFNTWSRRKRPAAQNGGLITDDLNKF